MVESRLVPGRLYWSSKGVVMAMRKDIWRTPFGLTFLFGSAFALIAGFAAGRNGFIGSGGPEYNSSIALNEAGGLADENLLMSDYGEPATDGPAPRGRSSTAPPPSEPETKEVDPSLVDMDRPAPADEINSAIDANVAEDGD